MLFMISPKYIQEINTMVMTFLNSMVNFVFRLPELSILFYLCFRYFFSIKKNMLYYVLCMRYNFCFILFDISNSFFVLILSFNFFIYYKFNTNFKLFVSSLLKRHSPKKNICKKSGQMYK